MLELLVVMTIVAVLAGATFGVLGMLKRKANHLATRKMIAEEIVVAMNTYLAKWPALGDRSERDFRTAPWQYLFTRPKRTNMGELTFVSVKHLVKVGVGSKTCETVQRHEQATHIMDYFGTGVDNLINFSIVSGGANRTRYTKAVEIRSSVGTPTRPNDDILYRYVAACDKATTTYSPGDAGKFVSVDNVIGAWTDPLDMSATSTLSDKALQQELMKAQ